MLARRQFGHFSCYHVRAGSNWNSSLGDAAVRTGIPSASKTILVYAPRSMRRRCHRCRHKEEIFTLRFLIIWNLSSIRQSTFVSVGIRIPRMLSIGKTAERPECVTGKVSSGLNLNVFSFPPPPPKPPVKCGSWFWDYAIGYYSLEFMYWLSSFFPSLVPSIAKTYFNLLYKHPREVIDRSDKVER